VRYNVRRRRGRHLRSSGSRAASSCEGESNVMISNHGSDLAAWFSSRGAPLLAASTAIPETSTERGAVWRIGGPRTCERRAEWRVGGPRARERGVQWRKWRGSRALGCSRLSVFSCRRAGGLDAAALPRWVLHGSGLLVWWCLPLLLLYQRWNTSVVSIAARVRW